MMNTSICMITYNHELSISQAIEGVLMQQTTFPFELIIGEDCSTDKTREICEEFKTKYPDKIRLLLPESNLGMTQNFISTVQAATGKYIAICEGDDYWTDPYKLQKQVDFLEVNPNYSLICHRYKIYDVNTKKWKDDYGSKLFKNNEIGVIVDNKLNYEVWLTKTLTLMFRTDAINLKLLTQYKYSRDVHLCYHLLKNNVGYCMNFIGAVYRTHDGGVFSSLSDLNRKRMSYLIYKELVKFNAEDEVLKAHSEFIYSMFFDTIRFRIKNKEYNKVLFNDLIFFLKNECRLNNIGLIFFYLKKILLSIIKSFK